MGYSLGSTLLEDISLRSTFANICASTQTKDADDQGVNVDGIGVFHFLCGIVV